MKRVALAALLLLAGCADEPSPPRPAPATLVSLGAGDWSDAPSLSADGSRIAFESAADRLTADDTNDVLDVFVRDVARGATILVSVSSAGTAGNDYSHDPSLSADGRLVAFTSRADNLVPGDTNEQDDVFVRDLEAGTTLRISVATDGAEGDHYSIHPSISPDGRFVAFESRASNLAPDDTNGVSDIFVRDLQAGLTVRVTAGDNASSRPAISAGGRWVVFESSAALVPDDRNECIDIYRFDFATGTTERVSLGTSGVEADADSASASVSADGRFVAFESLAGNLDDSDLNQDLDVYVRDMYAQITRRLSSGRAPSVSSDGRRIAIESLGLDGVREIVVVDRGTNSIRHFIMPGHCNAPSLSGDGRFVSFGSAGDGTLQVYLEGPVD